MITTELYTGQINDFELSAMVAAHYDDDRLMRLSEEIYFADELSNAEIDAAVRALHAVTGASSVSETVYLPCAGTLRHAVPLLQRGAQRVVAVDLSGVSLDEGLRHYGEQLGERVSTYKTDIRNLDIFGTPGGFSQAFLLGNSLGDVTDLDGHQGIIQSFSDSLAPGGTFVFDYVGDRYNPLSGKQITSEWTDTYTGPEGQVIDVLDRRSRRYSPLKEGIGILSLTCEVNALDGSPIVSNHKYEKLTITDSVLREQFTNAGMTLHMLGPIAGISEYHERRIRDRDDLGMMGAPNHLYVAVKNNER